MIEDELKFSHFFYPDFISQRNHYCTSNYLTHDDPERVLRLPVIRRSLPDSKPAMFPVGHSPFKPKRNKKEIF